MAKVELSVEEMRNIYALCDMGIRQEGIKVVPVLFTLAQKMQDHIKEDASKEEEKPQE